MSPDRIAQILLALLAAGGLSLGGFQTSEAGTCRDLLRDQNTVCVATLEQMAGSYSEALDLVRDLCRE